MELNDKGALITTFLYLQFGWQALYVSLLVYTNLKLINPEVNMSKNKLKKIQLINISTGLMNSMFAIPIFQICLAFLACNQNKYMSQSFMCFEGTYFLHFIVALVSLLLHIFNSVLYHIFYQDPNPFSSHPYAIPFTRQSYIKPLLKVLLPLYSFFKINVNLLKYIFSNIFSNLLIKLAFIFLL